MDMKAPTGSCVATFRKNGDVYAIAHTHKSTGYKSQDAATKFDGTTSYKEGYCSAMSNSTPNRKPLVPYKAGSSRNRLPVVFNSDESIQKLSRKMTDPLGGAPKYNQTFVTTNQRTFVQHKGTPIGYGNQGIVAERTKWSHKRQNE
uniref:Uncharacterized protein n=1 Tax=Eutreptiella gymnastica TaxID=73025 RepID=A0A7S1I004_9EUGL